MYVCVNYVKLRKRDSYVESKQRNIKVLGGVLGDRHDGG